MCEDENAAKLCVFHLFVSEWPLPEYQTDTYLIRFKITLIPSAQEETVFAQSHTAGNIRDRFELLNSGSPSLLYLKA